MRANREAGVQHKHAVVGPGRQQPTFIWRRGEVWVVVLEALVDVDQRWGCWCGWADGEREAVGLVQVMIGVLAYDYCLDGVERCVP